MGVYIPACTHQKVEVDVIYDQLYGIMDEEKDNNVIVRSDWNSIVRDKKEDHVVGSYERLKKRERKTYM